MLPGTGDYEYFPITDHPNDPRNDVDDYEEALNAAKDNNDTFNMPYQRAYRELYLSRQQNTNLHL